MKKKKLRGDIGGINELLSINKHQEIAYTEDDIKLVQKLQNSIRDFFSEGEKNYTLYFELSNGTQLSHLRLNTNNLNGYSQFTINGDKLLLFHSGIMLEPSFKQLRDWVQNGDEYVESVIIYPKDNHLFCKAVAEDQVTAEPTVLFDLKMQYLRIRTSGVWIEFDV
jgi:hypothetical protein